MLQHPSFSPPRSPVSESSKGIDLSEERCLCEPNTNPLSRPASPGSATSSGRSLQLSIKCPSLGTLDCDTRLMTVTSEKTIRHVKTLIEETWPGRPKAEGMRCIRAGRLLADEDIIGQVFAESDRHGPAALHLVIRPDAWSEPHSRGPNPPKSRNTLASIPRSFLTDYIDSAAPTVPAVNRLDFSEAVAAPSVAFASDRQVPRRSPSGLCISEALACPTSDSQLYDFVASLDPSQYRVAQSLVTLAYHKYADIYDICWFKVYGQDCLRFLGQRAPQRQTGPVQLTSVARSMGLGLQETVQSLEIFEELSLRWHSIDLTDGQGRTSEETHQRYRQITLDGLPFLLRLTGCEATRYGDRLLYDIAERLNILQDLSVRLDRLINFQNLLSLPFSPSNDNSSRPGLRLRLERHRQDATTIAAAQRQGRRRPRMHPTLNLNLEEAFHVLFAVLFLSFKMAILVYIFTKGASELKKTVLIATAVVYIALEAWKLAKRRQARREQALQHRQQQQEVAQEQQEYQQQREQDPRQRHQAETAQHTTTVSEAEAEGDDLTPRAPSRAVTASPVSVEFWLEKLAYLHLEDEDGQLGFRLHSDDTRGSPRISSNTSRGVLSLIHEILLLPLFLAIATLVPEIEERRRRAIEARNALIRGTARKFEERISRALQKAPPEDPKTNLSSFAGQLNQEGQNQTRATSEAPALLKTVYAQRLLEKYRNDNPGRQLDVQEELDAAAAQNAGRGGEEADMGFF